MIARSCAGLVFSLLACSQAASGGEVTPLFATEATLHARIEAPLRTLTVKRSDEDYLAGTFSWVDTSGQEQLLDLKLRARGNYRRQKKTCQFPPVRLNFRKKQVVNTEFAGQDKLKLVTHCNRRYEQYVLKEYLAYKIFNLLSDYSFRARLLRITWVDTERDGKSSTHYAFLIEDDDSLATRIDAEPLGVPRISYSDLDPAQANLVTVFEYLIGNTDFSMVVGALGDDCCHNIVLFSQPSGGHLAVPYDFDFSGLVNARYASPNPKLPIRKVIQRLYRGLCTHLEPLDGTLALLRENEQAIKQLVPSVEGLEEKSRDQALAYIEAFYEDIATEQLVQRNLVSNCS